MALSELSILTSEESAVTDQTALQTTNILSSIVSESSSEAEIQDAVQVQSNLLPKVENDSSEASLIGQAILDLVGTILNTTVSKGNTTSLSTSNIVVLVIPFDSLSPPSSSNEDNIKVTIPSGISSTCNDTKLSRVFYKGSLYKRLAPVGFEQTSDTLSL